MFMINYECLKCGNEFIEPEKAVIHLNGCTRVYEICPLCKSRSMIRNDKYERRRQIYRDY